MSMTRERATGLARKISRIMNETRLVVAKSDGTYSFCSPDVYARLVDAGKTHLLPIVEEIFPDSEPEYDDSLPPEGNGNGPEDRGLA